MTFEIRDGVYDKSNRVYDINGIAPTLTVVSAENERYIIYNNYNEEDIMNDDKPVLVGGIGEINFGKQFRQGNRVYDSENTAMCLMSQPVGNAGGYSYLYKVKNKLNYEGGNITMKEFTNNFTKYNFKMEDVKVFDTFAGIGSLHQSLKELGVQTKIIGLSETDVDAIISYAGIHINKFKNLEFSYPSEDEMKKLLMDRNIGWDFTKNKSSIPRLKKDKLYKVYKATMLLNNLGDISKLDYKKLSDFDLLNLSFCCQDISGAGQQKGLKNADGSPTRSGLVTYGIEVIKAKKPKYIMIENVKALIQKKFIDDFYDITNEIESYGYKCYYPTKENGQPICLNAKDYGIAQNRERIFVICVRNDVDDGLFEFPKGFDGGLRLKDFLEDEVDEKYYLSQEIQDRFKLNGKEDINRNELNQIGTTGEDKTIGQRDRTYGVNGIIPNLTATDYKQPKQILDSNKLSFVGGIGDKDWVGDDKQLSRNYPQGNRVYDSEGIACSQTAQGGGIGSFTGLYKEGDTNKLIQQGELDLEGYNDFSKRVYSQEGMARTLMASGGNLNDKAGQYQMNDFRIRRLTPRECWRLMGFKDECFDKAKELGISDSALYKQAGNSIVVNCLYYIFKELFKKYIVKQKIKI